MGDRYDEMDKSQLLREAKNRGIASVGAEAGDEDEGIDPTDGSQLDDDTSESELRAALRAYDEAQPSATAENEDEGTSEDASRTEQRPGAGDPKGSTATPPVAKTVNHGAGESLLGNNG